MTDFVEVKTQDLSGAALDWAVHASFFGNDGPDWDVVGGVFGTVSLRDVRIGMDGIGQEDVFHPYQPSTDWAQGGPLIEAFKLDLEHDHDRSRPWVSYQIVDPRLTTKGFAGETPLIAVCRAIVASHFGDTVSVPKELCHE
ncbi:phage protein NinX family protein [Pseudomonas saponiphila]|uniref:phage protein NinX family protein n=1 Tax=Pseudomonas saponiphila TaxID=556534 RepID=UPI00224092F7|nr:phage protein NinX family protein [Pseudomonas saponiphila]